MSLREKIEKVFHSFGLQSPLPSNSDLGFDDDDPHNDEARYADYVMESVLQRHLTSAGIDLDEVRSIEDLQDISNHLLVSLQGETSKMIDSVIDFLENGDWKIELRPLLTPETMHTIDHDIAGYDISEFIEQLQLLHFTLCEKKGTIFSKTAFDVRDVKKVVACCDYPPTDIDSYDDETPILYYLFMENEEGEHSITVFEFKTEKCSLGHIMLKFAGIVADLMMDAEQYNFDCEIYTSDRLLDELGSSQEMFSQITELFRQHKKNGEEMAKENSNG